MFDHSKRRPCWICLGLFAGLTGCTNGANRDDVNVQEDDVSVQEHAASASGGPSDAGVAPGLDCSTLALGPCPDPKLRFADVQPIFNQHCVVCHSGDPDGPWPLTSYEHVASWYDTIRSEMLSCGMPPPDAGMPPLDDDDRRAILLWLKCGFPR